VLESPQNQDVALLEGVECKDRDKASHSLLRLSDKPDSGMGTLQLFVSRLLGGRRRKDTWLRSEDGFRYLECTGYMTLQS
jgi:hypothetical protein